MGRLGGGEILLILLIALLIFGPSKLASMGKGLGEGLKNFKKGISHADDDEPSAEKEKKEIIEAPKMLPPVSAAAPVAAAAPPAAEAPRDPSTPQDAEPRRGNVPPTTG